MISRSLPAYTPEELTFRGPLVPRCVATTFIAVQFLNRPHRVGDRRKLCRSAAGDMDLSITDYDIHPLPPPAGLVRRLLFLIQSKLCCRQITRLQDNAWSI